MTLELKQETHTPRTDYTVENHGSIYLLRANNDDALDWFKDHVGEDSQWFGKATLAVEQRYIVGLVANLREDGYTVD